MTKHTWNHRVIKQTKGDEVFYSIHEVHYTDGKPDMVTENPTPAFGETVDELRETLERMLASLDKDVLNYEDF